MLRFLINFGLTAMVSDEGCGSVLLVPFLRSIVLYVTLFEASLSSVLAFFGCGNFAGITTVQILSLSKLKILNLIVV